MPTQTVVDQRSFLSSTPEWPIHEIVVQLSDVRRISLEARNRLQKPSILPSRESLARIVEKLALVMFPNRLGNRVFDPASIDYFVGHMLDITLNDLLTQAEIEMDSSRVDGGLDWESKTKAIDMVRSFSHELPAIRSRLDGDIQAAYEADPAARTLDEILGCYPGVFALIHYRIANALFVRGLPLMARIISEIAHSKTGIDIHPGAKIGEEFFIDHGTGVVIGETAIIGNRVRLYHGVTLGAKGYQLEDPFTPKTDTRRHPLVEDDVVIFAKATILGAITIGSNSIIGSNVCITQNIPSGSHVSQAIPLFRTVSGGEGI